MSRNMTATDEVEIEVLYTTGAHSKGAEFDEDGEAFELARDLRGFGTDAFDDFDRDPQHALDTAYDTLFEFTADAELDDVHDTGELLEELYERMQGGRRDEQVGYDGSETRSLGVGDVIVVDGQPFMVDRVGFTDMAARYQVEIDDEGDDELVADGGREPVTFDGYREIDSAYYLITQHARKSRQAGYDDHADELFELSKFLLDALTFGEKSDGLDRDDYSVTVEGEKLDLLYEAFEYAVEQEATTGPVQARDVALARRVYNHGSTDPKVTTDAVAELDAAPDATPVYAHRERSNDPYVSDFVFCTFGHDHVDALDGAGASATEWVESQVMQQFDDDEQLDDLLPSEAERVAADDDPTRVGTLHFDADGGQVVALELDADALDD